MHYNTANILAMRTSIYSLAMQAIYMYLSQELNVYTHVHSTTTCMYDRSVNHLYKVSMHFRDVSTLVFTLYMTVETSALKEP